MSTEPVLRPFTGLSAPQIVLLTDTKSKTVIYDGGKGAGKTLGGAWKAVSLSGMNPPGTDGLIIGPKYRHLVNPILPTLLEVLQYRRIPYEFNRSDWVITLPGNRRMWMRSGSNPDDYAGINAVWGWIDEAAQTSADVKKEIVARLRKVIPGARMCRQLIITTTPKGRRTWVYEMEVANDPTTRVIRATPYDNPGNPEDWLQDMERTYANDPAGHAQDIRGIATDMSGTIYTNLTPSRHFKPCPNPSYGQIVVGGDFNNHILPTPIFSWYPEGGPLSKDPYLHCWAEVVTQQASAQTEPHYQNVVRTIQKRCPGIYRNEHGRLVDQWLRPVLGFIDASANHNRNVPVTSRQLIHALGFSIRSANSNPHVGERVDSVQYAFAFDRLFIDADAAPLHARALREHDWDKHGDPRKSTGPSESGEFQPDHFCDAFGYPVAGLIPIGSRHYKAKDGKVTNLFQLANGG